MSDPSPPLLTSVDHQGLRMAEVKRLIGTALKMGTAELFHLPLGSSEKDLQFPALFIEPDQLLATMQTTERHQLDGKLSCYLYFVGDGRSELALHATTAEGALLKLFGNNALGDLHTSGQTNKWKANPTILGGISDNAAWYDSDMTFNHFRAGKFGRRPGEALIRLLLCTFTWHAAVVL